MVSPSSIWMVEMPTQQLENLMALDLEGRRLRVEKAKGNAFTIITNFINLRSQFFRAIFISDGIVLVPRKFRIG
jgi:hypothetical protein